MASLTTPAMPPSKAGTASPRVTEEQDADFEGTAGDEKKLPLHDDIMQLARLGEIGPIKNLFDEGKYDPKYKDEEDITPLHWAAINNHYALCKYLVEAGADVDAVGGESGATPAMWAAQRCHLYVVHLLLQKGADPLLTDGQGYNILHLATFDGNVFLLLILLHANIPIDGPDPQGHTSLMWAAYKGYPACVELFLEWGASVSVRDENGFAALHWALVKGNGACIQKLIECGADRFAETNDHKTPDIVAHEMKSKPQWHRALRELGFNSDGTIKQLPSPYLSFVKTRIFLERYFFLSPFVLLFAVFNIVAYMPIYASIPLALVVAYSLQWVSQQALNWAPSDMKHIHRTPYLAGVFAGTLFWVGVRWATAILTNTFSSHIVYNLVFAVCYGLCAYFYTLAMLGDPGFVPKLGSRIQQKAVIDELIGLWSFDDRNFCVSCMIRQPLRSKHCRRCARCVAKHDHHCPWIHNCVGANNHRHFILYVINLFVGAIIFVRLVLYHLEALPPSTQTSCNILPDEVCQYILRDPFTVVIGIWTAVQVIWVTMLLVVQFVQITRAQTTYESMRGDIHSSSQASEAITSALTAGTTSMDGAQVSSTGMGPDPAVSDVHGHKHKEGYFAQWKKILGLDAFMKTALGSKTPRRRGNPFSRGVITNCKDFWFDPAPYFGTRETGAAMLDGAVINYARMYEAPSRMQFRRPRDVGEGGAYHNVDSDDVV